MKEYHISIDFQARTVSFNGVTFGYGIGNTLLLWEFWRLSGIIVVKKPGHSDWSSRGQSSYYPAQFMVLKITKELTEGEYEVETIIEFDIKRGPIDQTGGSR